MTMRSFAYRADIGMMLRPGCARIASERQAMKTLHGDGVKDDTQAIQDLMDGKDVRDARTGKIVPGNTLPPGNYLVDGVVMDA